MGFGKSAQLTAVGDVQNAPNLAYSHPKERADLYISGLVVKI